MKKMVLILLILSGYLFADKYMLVVASENKIYRQCIESNYMTPGLMYTIKDTYIEMFRINGIIVNYWDLYYLRADQIDMVPNNECVPAPNAESKSA